jgi:signal transduction histidine kinase
VSAPASTGLSALVLAPWGRDGQVARMILAEAGIEARTCEDLPTCTSRLDDDVTFLMLAEEAVRNADLRTLSGWLHRQPTWSDLPVLLLTRRGGGIERNPDAARWSKLLGNVSFIERPFHPTTLVSVARAALRNRQRQYEARSRLDDLHRSELSLRDLNETLEQRVAARSAELERAHRAMVEQSAQREHAEEQLRQAQKMEMVGQLTGGVAHDFNNLLMVVLVNLELLRRTLPADPSTLRLIEGAQQSAKRGAQLTQRLIAFARRQELKLEGRDVGLLLLGMRDLLERSLGQSIHLVFDISPDLPPAQVDANQLELAVLNLAVNARDAMPDGGELRFELSLAPPPEDLGLPPDPHLRLAVCDTGSGMDAETLRRATEPFFSTKGVGKGTGLGLSMIHGLARQLDGALRLVSTPGVGTCAELWLPRTDEPARAAEEELVAPLPPTPPLRVLLVDDDALIAEGTRRMLEELGHEVRTAGSGAAAIEALRGTTFDLMITDYSMPLMNGSQLARQARGIRPAMPILLATGYADFADGQGEELPRLNKPYRIEELAQEIRRLTELRAPED